LFKEIYVNRFFSICILFACSIFIPLSQEMSEMPERIRICKQWRRNFSWTGEEGGRKKKFCFAPKLPSICIDQ